MMPEWLRPEAFLLLPVVGLAWYWYRPGSTRSDDWQKILPVEFLRVLTPPDPVRTAARRSSFLWLASGLLLVVALSGPTWRDQAAPALAVEDNLVIVLDLSFSMWTSDQQPSRILRARQKINDLLAQRQEGSTALIAYAGSAHTVAPLTPDRATLHNLLPALDPGMMPSPGSRPDLALRQASLLLDGSPSGQGRILWVTDDVPVALLGTLRTWLQQNAHPISLLALGTEEGGPIPVPNRGFLRDRGEVIIAATNHGQLRELMQQSGHRFAPLSLDDSDLDSLLPASDTTELALSARQLRHPEDAGYWFLFPAALLAMLATYKGGFACLVAVLVFSLQVPVVRADDSIWQSADQNAYEKFKQGAFDAAASQFESPAWEAAARFRLGDTEGAAAVLEQLDTPLAHYNRGNALAASGDYEGALRAWEAALALEPEHAEARENRRRILEWLQQSQDSQSASGNTGQQADSGEQEQESSSQQGSQEDADPQQEPAEETSQAGTENKPEATESDAGAGEPEQMDTLQAGKSLDEQQTEQWLRRVPDDPGGLLRRKFILQFREHPPEEISGVPLW